MNIVGICPYFSPEYGTYENYLCHAFAIRGHKVSLYTSRLRQRRYDFRRGTGPSPIHQHLGFKVHYESALFDLVEMPYIPRIEENIRNRERDVDIFQAFDEFYQLCSVSMFRVSRKVKRPFVFIQERYYSPRRAWLKATFSVWQRLCVKVATQAEAIVVHSTDAARYLHSLKISTNRVTRIPNGVDFGLFSRDSTPFDSDRLESKTARILTVARLHPNKGIDNLLKAMGEVIRIYPETSLTILGRGPDEAKLKRLASGLGLDSVVNFRTEFVDHARMAQVYSDCDIFVLPSLIEPFGMAALEAMACGRPVVATMTGGIRDVITSGADGLLVPPGDSHSLAESLLGLIRDPALSEGISKNAVETARRHDWSIIADRMLDIYRECL